MCKTGMVCVLLFFLLSWSTTVMAAQEQVAEEIVSRTEGDSECSHPERWSPTQAELEKILADHWLWLSSDDHNFDDERRADLCNAQLTGSALSDANKAVDPDFVSLRYAKLNGADLHKAELNGADLHKAELNGADLSNAELNGADLGNAELNGAFLRYAELNEADLSGAELNCLNPGTSEEKCAFLGEPG